MSKQLFTDKQIADLILNPNVFSVTRSTLMLTKSFKEKFYAEYQKGALPRDILKHHGFSSDVIGQRRIWSITQHIKDEYAKYGEFHEGRKPPGPSKGPAAVSGQDPLSRLESRVEYLQQQVEFLKKITSVGISRK